MLDHPEALDAVYAVRTALHDAVGGIGQWDGHGFTNEDDRLIWCDPSMELRGETRAAILDESTGEWIPFELDLDNPDELAAFLRGEIPEGRGSTPPPTHLDHAPGPTRSRSDPSRAFRALTRPRFRRPFL